MMSRLSLAEKYEQAKKENTTHYLRGSPVLTNSRRLPEENPSLAKYTKLEPVRSPDGGRFLTYGLKSYDFKDTKKPRTPYYSDVRKQYKLPGHYGSPIKAISTPLRARRPTRLYKLLPHLPDSRKDTFSHINGVKKDRPWETKQAGGSGILKRFRSFISRFSIEAHEQDDTSYKQLSNSAKGLLDIPRDSEYRLRKAVNFEEAIKTPPRKGIRDAYQIDDLDEVDLGVKLARARQEETRRNREQAELKSKYEEAKREGDDMRESYERKLYLLKRDHEAKEHELTMTIQELSQRASHRYQELGQEKLMEIQSAVLKENESFLIHQKATEDRLALLNKRIELREAELRQKEARIEELAAKIPRKAQSSFLEVAESPIRPDFVGAKTKISRSLETNKEEFELNEATLKQELDTVVQAIRMNDVEVVQFYDIMQRISERILNKREKLSYMETRLLDNLDRLVSSLDEHINYPPRPAGGLRARFVEYSNFFAEFDDLYTTQHATAKQTYNEEVMGGIAESFAKLRKSLFSKLTKRAIHLQDLENQFKREKVSEHNYDDYKVEQVVKILKNKADTLTQQKDTVELLQIHNGLTKKLKDIQTIMENDSQ